MDYHNDIKESKIWDNIISPLTIGFDGQDAFSPQDCINSSLTVVYNKLAEKINFGIVLIWDKSQQMWTNFYAWHCWAVTKNGQPFDCSVNHWNDIFSQLIPPIIPEKNPQQISCQLINQWGNKDVFSRSASQADVVYINGGMTSQNLHLIPKKVKTIIYLSGKYNGFTLEQIQKLLKN